MARPQLARPRDHARVHPASAANPVADADRRAAQPHEERRPRPAVEIDGEIEAHRAEPPAERDVADEPARPADARRDDDFVQMRIALDDRRGGRLDDVGEVRVGKSIAQRADGRRREHDVADFTQADEKNS